MTEPLITTHQIIDTNVTVYEAWEPSTLIDGFPSHTTLRRVEGVWYGAIPSRTLPAYVEQMPPGEERTVSAAYWRTSNEIAAVNAILAVHPDLPARGGQVKDGAVEVTNDRV